jgi:hypothetical protein
MSYNMLACNATYGDGGCFVGQVRGFIDIWGGILGAELASFQRKNRNLRTHKVRKTGIFLVEGHGCV